MQLTLSFLMPHMPQRGRHYLRRMHSFAPFLSHSLTEPPCWGTWWAVKKILACLIMVYPIIFLTLQRHWCWAHENFSHSKRILPCFTIWKITWSELILSRWVSLKSPEVQLNGGDSSTPQSRSQSTLCSWPTIHNKEDPVYLWMEMPSFVEISSRSLMTRKMEEIWFPGERSKTRWFSSSTRTRN